MKEYKNIDDIYEMLMLMCKLMGEYLILNYPSDKYYILKILSEHIRFDDDEL